MAFSFGCAPTSEIAVLSCCCTSSGLVIAAMSAGSARDDGKLQQYVSCKQKFRVVSVSNARCFGTAKDCIVSVNGSERRCNLSGSSRSAHLCRAAALTQVNRMWDILESPGKCTLTVLRPTDPWPGCGGLKSDPGSERGVSMKPGS